MAIHGAKPMERPGLPCILKWLSKIDYGGDTTIELDEETKNELRSPGTVGNRDVAIMEAPGGEYTSERAIELRISAAGRNLEEARAEALEHLPAMGFEDMSDIEVEECGDYYRMRVGAGAIRFLNLPVYPGRYRPHPIECVAPVSMGPELINTVPWITAPVGLPLRWFDAGLTGW
jgi:hypothetical protein